MLKATAGTFCADDAFYAPSLQIFSKVFTLTVCCFSFSMSLCLHVNYFTISVSKILCLTMQPSFKFLFLKQISCCKCDNFVNTSCLCLISVEE